VENPEPPELHSVPVPVGSRARRDARADGSCQPPLLISVPTEYAELRQAAETDPGLVRAAVQQLGSGEAIRVYGVRLVNAHAHDLIATGT
jgi:hypothetical protein